ncbi:MAG: hypothetical protein Q8Q58_09695, partial [Candidatus Rokubacteria bacterium]|nr:hypothetical protein [Candidatus Rokubacteria bacterium]
GFRVAPLLPHSVEVHDPLGDFRQQLGAVESPEPLLRDQQRLPPQPEALGRGHVGPGASPAAI